ncbi:hypothetical protein MKW92_017842 [Papaver armeniacum]|nr:hypothetical protein MKW92_017842 [Papaver armeniacum]
MAKTHHLSFFSPLLIGFLLVLFVSDLAYVRGKSCQLLGSVDFGIVDPELGDAVFLYCLDECLKIDPRTEYYVTGSDEETGQRACACCLWG